MNFVKFLRTPFFIEHLRLKGMINQKIGREILERGGYDPGNTLDMPFMCAIFKEKAIK